MNEHDLEHLKFLKHNYKACLDIIEENTCEKAVAFAKSAAPILKAQIQKFGPLTETIVE